VCLLLTDVDVPERLLIIKPPPAPARARGISSYDWAAAAVPPEAKYFVIGWRKPLIAGRSLDAAEGESRGTRRCPLG